MPLSLPLVPEGRGVVCGKGDGSDNAVAESFWSTIKAELSHDVDFPSRATAEQALFEYIKVFYNR